MWKVFCCTIVLFALAAIVLVDTQAVAAEDGKTGEPNQIPAKTPPVPTPTGSQTLPPPLLSQLVSFTLKVEGREQKFVISPAQDLVALTSFVEKPQGEAMKALKERGFDVQLRGVDDENSQPGIVIRQEPDSGNVEPGSKVKLYVVQTRIAIQPYSPEENLRTSGGQIIVHRLFDMQLKDHIQNIPMFAVNYAGPKPEGVSGEAALEARAKNIAERLAIAWVFMGDGGYLGVDDDKWVGPDDPEVWRLTDPYKHKEDSQEAMGDQYAIYIRHKSLGSNPLRIMTVYPEDAALFGTCSGKDGKPELFKTKELTEYLVAIIKAHHLLFAIRSDQIGDYDKLELSKTREGRIFKDIYLQAQVAAAARQKAPSGRLSVDEVRDSLARIALDQRYRLQSLAVNPPSDWRFRNGD